VRINAFTSRDRIGAAIVRLKSLVRRVAVASSPGGRWQLTGYEGEPTHTDIEVFSGIGISSRPSATSVGNGDAEAIMVRVGSSRAHPVIIATRDESVRVDLEEDETAIYNSSSIVKIKADGTIEIGSRGGSVAALALKSDVQAVKDAIANAVPLAGDGGAQLQTQIIASLTLPTVIPVGTTKLKAE
jgi:phage gp45-like